MDVITFDPLAHVDSVIGLWNRHEGQSFPLDPGLLRQNLGFRPEETKGFGIRSPANSSAGTPTGTELDGFLIARRGPSSGSISLLMVDKAARRSGMGTELLGAAEAWIASGGGRTLRLGADFPHFLPGAPLDHPEGGRAPTALEAFLQARGFVGQNLEHDLRATIAPPASGKPVPAPTGLSWVHALPEHRSAAEAFFGAEFPGRWAEEYQVFLDRGLPPEDLLFLREEGRGRVLGFCRLCRRGGPWRQPGLYWQGLLRPQAGALGPVGIAASERGKGLGLLLFRRGLDELALSGVEDVVIDWTDLPDFYAKLGFTIWKTYRPFSKPLRPEEPR